MKKNYKSILCTGSFIIGALLTGQVLAQQKSSYTPFVHTGYSDYKIHYDPQGTRVINNNGETTVTTGHANFSFEKIKIFLPPGTKRFYANFQTYSSPTEAKAAARFGEVPVATADNVNQNTKFLEIDKTLHKLLLGNELLFYSPGKSGALSISQPSSTDNSNAVKGGYIYLNLLSIPAGSILSVQTRMVVDEACYRRWYATAKWDFQGNPDENANHTCDGSGGTTPVTPTEPTLNSIKLSTETWKAGTTTANQPITVNALDVNGSIVALPNPNNCIAAVTNGSSLEVSSVLKITPDSNGKQAQITIEKPELITKAEGEEIKITCGDKSASLKLFPADPTPLLTGITLSPSTWKIGTDTGFITVIPKGNNNPLLPATCSSSNPDLVNLSQPSDSKLAKFSVTGTVTANTDVTITCEDANGANKQSADLSLQPADVATLASSVTESTVQNITTLSVQLKHTAAELAASEKVDYFVAVHIPQFAHPFDETNDAWAFLVETGAQAANWKILFWETPLEQLFFKQGVDISTGNEVTLPINLQLSIDALQSYNAKLYLGYRQGANGTFKVLANPIWQATTP